jgi:hypothetical protein
MTPQFPGAPRDPLRSDALRNDLSLYFWNTRT